VLKTVSGLMTVLDMLRSCERRAPQRAGARILTKGQCHDTTRPAAAPRAPAMATSSTIAPATTAVQNPAPTP